MNNHMGNQDFITITANALPREICAEIIAHMRASDGLQPGRIGGGVYPELKHSRDITLTGNPAWQQVEQTLNMAMLRGLIQYLREYPHF